MNGTIALNSELMQKQVQFTEKMNEYENKVRCEQGNFALCGSSLGSRLGSRVFLDLRAVMMEAIFRAADAEEPSQTNREYGSKRKEEYYAPGNAELVQKRGHTVTDKGTDTVRHAVPDDTAADILARQISRLDVENIAPKHTLGKTVNEPDIFHRLNGRRNRNTEITECRYDHRKRNGIFRITVFGDKCVDELTRRIAEKVERADRARNRLIHTEFSANGNQICSVAKSANISGRIGQTAKQDQKRGIFSV